MLIAGGATGGRYVTDRSALFDPIANKWTLVNSMKHGRKGAGYVVLPNGLALVMGGRDVRIFLDKTEIFATPDAVLPAATVPEAQRR